jgi:hypothetical protein
MRYLFTKFLESGFIMGSQQKLIDSVSRVLWDTDLISSRLTLALGEIFWGIMLLWPGQLFDSPIYAHMALTLSATSWGLIFLLTALAQLCIVITDALHCNLARYFSGWSMVLWLYVSLTMLISIYPPPMAIGGEIALAMSATWVWLRPYLLVSGYKRVKCKSII